VSSAYNNTVYFKNENRGASAHYFVDDNSIWQCVEEKDKAWHCGTKGRYYNGARNENSIGIEMCCYKNNGVLDISDKTILNTIELTKDIMKRYNIPAENVVRHYDVTKKVCPAPFVEDNSRWLDFKNRLVDTPTPKPTPKNTIEVDGIWGKTTTKKAQEVFKTTIDGIVSNQYDIYKSKNPGLSSSSFEWEKKPSKNGSSLIKAIQKKTGIKQDGYIGDKTIKAMQKWLGTTQDGYVSRPSNMVKAFQKWLNEN
jgi:N-acetylmuramoyl-L-alanine amidase CwlA